MGSDFIPSSEQIQESEFVLAKLQSMLELTKATPDHTPAEVRHLAELYMKVSHKLREVKKRQRSDG